MCKNRGFTLIELLVVVLIIGILSAVALPQYQLAVDKARWSNMVALTEPFRKAVEIAYMANGAPPGWDELDLDMPSSCRLIGGQKDHYDCDGLYIDLYEGTTLNLRAWGGGRWVQMSSIIRGLIFLLIPGGGSAVPPARAV